MELSNRLKALIARTDVDKDPLLVANAAQLLAKAQQLEKQVDSLERGKRADPPVRRQKSQADWADEILRDGVGPMHYREIAAEMKSRGFQHARQPKNPEKQLGDSVWTAMHEDPRFTRVGRGVFDLTERL